jgi:hypothetical protein
MTGLVLGDVMPTLDDPEPSETKLGRAWGATLDWDRALETAGAPTVARAAPLDKAALERRYGPETAYAPRWHTGTFRVPYGMRIAQFEELCREMARRWFEWKHKQGYDLVNGVAPAIDPGPNPSRDLQTGLLVPGYRDYLIRAQFVKRQPETRRLEVPGELFSDDWQPSQAPTSGDD